MKKYRILKVDTRSDETALIKSRYYLQEEKLSFWKKRPIWYFITYEVYIFDRSFLKKVYYDNLDDAIFHLKRLSKNVEEPKVVATIPPFKLIT